MKPRGRVQSISESVDAWIYHALTRMSSVAHDCIAQDFVLKVDFALDFCHAGRSAYFPNNRLYED
jgi:hypothetical protein